MTHTTVEPYLLSRFDRVSRQLRLHAETAAELREWQAMLRLRLRLITGMDTMEACPLDPVLGAIEQLDGYTRQHVAISVEPGVRMPLYALVPADLRDGVRLPVVLAPHGHESGGKSAVVGLRDTPELSAAVTEYNYDYGVQLVRRGFVVLCPDARGFGERLERTMQAENDPLGGSCRVINNMAIPLGQTLTGMWTWDLIRLIDYAITRPDCDSTRVAAAGLSGGGHQVLWLAALDERVQCAVVSGYYYGYKDSLLRESQNCSCNYVPGLWQAVDMGDIGALIAPRPLLIETGARDPLNGERGVVNVTDQLAITRGAYQLLGEPERLAHSIFDGGHRWHGLDALPWVERWLL